MKKLCECGCGRPTKIITRTDKRQGRIEGEYSRYVFGHAMRGKHHSKKANELNRQKHLGKKLSKIHCQKISEAITKQLFCKIEGCSNKHVARGLCRKHYGKQYRIQNKGYIIKQSKQWYLDNKEHAAKVKKQYRQTLAGRASMKAQKARRRILDKYLTKETVQRVYEDNIKKYGVLTCILCNKPIVFGDDSLEHLTPVSRGGSNFYDNLGVAHLSCNMRKFTKTLSEWNLMTIIGLRAANK